MKEEVNVKQVDVKSYIQELKRNMVPNDDYIALRSSMMQSETKSIFGRKITTNKDSIRIVPLGDVHFGHKNCDVTAFQSVVKHILTHDDTYSFLVGDLLETATKKSIGAGLFEEDSHLNKQVDSMKKMLKPLADAGKILGGVDGNHEDRVYQLTSLCPVAQICQEFNIPFQQYQMYYILEINNMKYKVFLTHGKGGGSSKTTKIKNVAKPSEIAPLMDLYISGHYHSDISDKDKVMYVDEEGNIKEHIRRFVMCGSFMKYYGSYAEQAVLQPSIVGAPQIFLFSNYKNILVLN
jgi:predicted phosphodiesterase